jgi:YD repeat-containing protein
VLWCVIIALTVLISENVSAQTLQYSYDSMRRLTRVTHPDGTAIDYVYDALGNRLMKTTTLPGAPSNQPPAAVTNPSLANGVTNVPTTAILSWSPAVDPNSGDSVVYFIYFGTSPTPPLVFSGWTTNWSPGKLRGLTTYYWQVVARDSHNAQTASPVWSFTTGNEPPVADFAASPTNGWAPLLVTFSDRSFDTDNAVVSWQWDFDNSGTVDSTSRNPTFTCTTPGDYTVRLTVRDEVGASTTMIKTNYITVLGTNIVDLAPLGLSIESAASYRNLLVRYAITNRGTISLSGKWQWADSLYISTNAVLDAQAVKIGTFYENQSLPAAAVYTRTNLVAIPDVAAQNYYLILKTDGQNQIGEISEANNLIAVPLTNTLPDLVAGSLAFSGMPVSGQALQATYSVTNRGPLAIDADWYDGFYLSTNSMWDAQDTRLGGVHVDLALQPGAGYLRTNTVTLAGWPPGDYYLILRADEYNWIVESNEVNNAISIPISLRVPDLAPVAFGVASNNVVFYPTSPQSPTIPVTWAVTNQGTGVASGYWYDQVYVSTNGTISGAISSPYFYESWSSTPLAVGAVYRRTNTVSLPQQSGTYYLIFQANGYNYLYEANTSNNTAVLPVPITVTYQVRPPDLAPVAFGAASNNVVFYPGNPYLSPMVPTTWAVTNRGTGAGAGDWLDGVYVSTNGTMSGAFMSYLFWESWSAPPLAPGAVFWRTNAITLPKQSGTYWLIFQTDIYDSLYEGNESNNVLTASVPVTLTYEVRPPDLAPVTFGVASNNVVMYPACPQSPTVPATWAVTNRGTGGAADVWYDQVYVSTNGTVSGAVRTQSFKESWTSLPLAAGAVYRRTNAITLPQQSGTYWLIFEAAPYPFLYESNKSNNVLAASLPVTLTYEVRPVDLVPMAFGVASNNVVFYPSSPESPAVSATWAVTNQGTGGAAGVWYDLVYVSTNGTVSGAVRSQTFAESWSSLPLAAGAVYRRTNAITLPPQSGTYWLIFQADTYNYLCENNESNNVLAASVPVTLTYEVRPPDLVPLSLSRPSPIPSDQEIEIMYTVTNQGNGTAYGNYGIWEDRLFLSTNAVWEEYDYLLGDFYQFDSVTNGGTYTQTNKVRLPGWPAGLYYLILKVDVNSLLNVYESVETNNTLVVPIVLQPPAGLPDLAPLSLSAPTSALPGQSIQIVCAVTNKGNAAAIGPWYDELYLSTNAVLDWQDTYLAFWPVSNSVTSGGSYVTTNTVSLPRGVAGAYYLILQTDSSDNLYESVETNNTLAVPVTIVVVTNAPGPQFRLLGATGDGAHPYSLVELRVNPVAEVLIGPSDYYTALDFSPEGELYGASSELCILNPTNGAVKRVVGTLRTAQVSYLLVDSIAFSPDGRLYAVAYDLTDDVEVLYQVDPATAFATEIGPIEGEYVWGIDFAPDGTLYGAEFDLVVLDPATGRVLSNIGPLADSVVDIDYAPDGAIYGVDDLTRQLYRINPNNAAAVVVGTYESELWGVASQPGVAATPTIMLAQMLGPGQMRMTITGNAGRVLNLQGTPDLFHWAVLGRYTNQSGTLVLTSVPPKERSAYFYRTMSVALTNPPPVAAPSLSGAQLLPDGRMRFQLNSISGSAWRIEGSPDLFHWGNYGVLTNPGTALQVTNVPLGKPSNYFYRVAQP